MFTTARLCDQGGGGRRLAAVCVSRGSLRQSIAKETERQGNVLLPGGGQGASTLVVAGKTVNAGLDENQAELGILVLARALKVLADGHGLLDEVVQILRDLRSQTFPGESAGLKQLASKVIVPLAFRIRRILLPVTDLT